MPASDNICAARPIRLGLIAAAMGGLITPAIAAAPPAPQSTARCDIGNANGENYQGPCIFTMGPKGSFSVVRYNNVRIIEDEIEVQVRIVAPGVAEVHGVTQLGTDTRWGRAVRSKACWRGEDFWVCAYALNARPVPGGNSPLATPKTKAPSPR